MNFEKSIDKKQKMLYYTLNCYKYIINLFQVLIQKNFILKKSIK